MRSFLLVFIVGLCSLFFACRRPTSRQLLQQAATSTDTFTRIIGDVHLGIDNLHLQDWVYAHRDTSKPVSIVYTNQGLNIYSGYIKTKNYKFLVAWAFHYGKGQYQYNYKYADVYVYLSETLKLKPNPSVSPVEDFKNYLSSIYGPVHAYDTSLRISKYDSFLVKGNMFISYSHEDNNRLELSYDYAYELLDRITSYESHRKSLTTEQLLAEEAIEKFNMAQKAGNVNDMWLEAGQAAQFYLEAKDYNNYKKWSDIANNLKYQIR